VSSSASTGHASDWRVGRAVWVVGVQRQQRRDVTQPVYERRDVTQLVYASQRLRTPTSMRTRVPDTCVANHPLLICVGDSCRNASNRCHADTKYETNQCPRTTCGTRGPVVDVPAIRFDRRAAVVDRFASHTGPIWTFRRASVVVMTAPSPPTRCSACPAENTADPHFLVDQSVERLG